MATSLLDLSHAEREEVERRLRLRTGRAEDARRARMILALDRGDSYTEVAEALACNRNYISRWKERFVEERLAGLYSRNLGRAVSAKTPKLEAKILAWTLNRKPRDGSTHWSTRKLAKELSVNQDRKSTRLNSRSRLHLVCRLLLEKKKTKTTSDM